MSASAKASFTNSSFCAWPASVTMLWPAQAFRFGSRVERGLGTTRPGQLAQRWLKAWPVLGRAAGQQSAFPFHHDAAHFAERGADQGNVCLRIGARHHGDPFGSSTRLAKAAPGADQPQAPVTRRRHLLGPRPEWPVTTKYEIGVGGATFGDVGAEAGLFPRFIHCHAGAWNCQPGPWLFPSHGRGSLPAAC